MSKRPTGKPAELLTHADHRQRAAALAHLVAYARDEALLLNDEFLAYCLDASLAAAQETLGERTPQGVDMLAATHAGSDAIGVGQLH